MRLVFTGAEPQTYADARDRIVEEVAEWLGTDPAEPPAALIGPILDFKYDPAVGRGDGRLALWREGDDRVLLLHHMPRQLVSPDPEQVVDALRHWLAFLDERGLLEPGSDSPTELSVRAEAMRQEFRDRFADPARYSPEAFWTKEMAEHGVDSTDPDAVDAFVGSVEQGSIDIDLDVLGTILQRESESDEPVFDQPQGHVLPAIDLPNADEAPSLAAATPLARALCALDDAVGTEPISVGDFHELPAETAARLAPAVAAPGLSAQRLVDIAVETGVVRPYKGQLVQVKKNRKLVRRPELLWARVLGLLSEWDRMSFADPEDSGVTNMVIDPGGEVPQFLSVMLYQGGTDGFTERDIVDQAIEALRNNPFNGFGLGGAIGDEFDFDDGGEPDESVSLTVRRFCNILVCLGAAERFTDSAGELCVRATSAGLSGWRDLFTEQGFTAYSRQQVAADSAELLLALVDSGLIDDKGVEAWIAARAPREAAEALIALAERTDDTDHRSIAFAMVVEELGDAGLGVLQERAANPNGGGFARSWLAARGFMDVEELSKGDWLLGLLDSLEALTADRGPDDWEPAESVESPPDLTTVFGDLPELLEGQRRSERVRARRVTERVAHTHPDPATAEAAQGALNRI